MGGRSIDTNINKNNGLWFLRLTTIVVVSVTLCDLLKFQKSFSKATTNNANGNVKRSLNNKQGGELEAGEGKTTIPLPILTRAQEKVDCPDNMFPAPILSNATAEDPTTNGNYRIPRIFHQTGEGRCLTKPFHDVAKAWGFEGAGWSYYFHDRIAKQTLLEKFWPEFPQLQNAYLCLKNAGGAATADLWRYLALWEYGGFYTDLDNAPGPLLNASTINTIFEPHLDAAFLQDMAGSPGFPSQHFFGVSPKHPIMYFAVSQVLIAMLNLDEVGTFNVPDITGPSALDRAFLRFMNVPQKDWAFDRQQWLRHPLTKPHKGTYTGYQDRTVTIVDNADQMLSYLRVGAIKGKEKRDGWRLMGANDYMAMNKVPKNKTCLQVIMEHHMERQQPPPQPQLDGQ